ncbi:gliding motility-associated protein GldE [Panacibacter ginsenosidivorans]|uniref:Gliding motility-associated protein GldE n=1 Tax=Panacibacter ginsenosidivorans TaxID=1813871 RepID=A0A5B8V8P1_9BACT|nr:gliding motility-associated protein GldE [Panacibacter ginsenosidivorans]QEC67076.1 gliding motility-associated protein GldE [Panacibacter ginsenosidivorans]
METVAVSHFQYIHPAYLASIDPRSTTALIILLLILIFFSFVVSGAEVAFFSLTNKDINLLKTKQQPPYNRVIDLLEQPKELFASFILANSFFNIGIIIILNILLDDITKAEYQWLEFVIKVVVVAVILVLFCEIMPKILARQNNIRYAKDFGVIAEGVFYIFKRPGAWFMRHSDAVERRFSRNSGRAKRMEEIYDAIDTTTPGDDENTTKEKDILKGIAKFSNIFVKQIMRTRLDVSGIDHKASFKELVKRIEELHYSRLPVYKDDLDEVVGIINTKDILPYLDNDDDFDWHFLMRQPYFVHENKLIDDLLQEFQAKRVHFAVVVDEFGGTSGIVTLEDILEEVIGEIKDEFDDEESGFKKLDDYNYIFDGRTSVSDVCKFMQLPMDTFNGVKGESDSLAGLVLEIAGEFPRINAVVNVGDFDFTVLEIARNRLQKIKITIRPKTI